MMVWYNANATIEYDRRRSEIPNAPVDIEYENNRTEQYSSKNEQTNPL